MVVRPQAHPKTHRVALRLIRENLSGGVVLDAGCGEGAFTERLSGENYRVIALDIEPRRFRLSGIPLVKGDLNHTLPFESNSFDCIVALEVVEHLDRWGTFIGEAYRILKPNGFFLISLPNILNLSSRLRYLVCGYPSLYSKERLKESPRHIHIALIPTPFLISTAEREGFKLMRIATDRLRRSALLLSPLLPLFYIITKLSSSYDPLVFKQDVVFGRTTLLLFQK